MSVNEIELNAIAELLEEVREPLTQLGEWSRQLDAEYDVEAEGESRINYAIADALKQLRENLSCESYIGVNIGIALEDVADVRALMNATPATPAAARRKGRGGDDDDC